MNNHRLSYLDITKGIAIFLVVIGHVEYLMLGTQSILYSMLANSHMPIFFFISGFLFYKRERDTTTLRLIGQKFYSLILPFLVVGSLFVLYKGANWSNLFFANMKLGYWFTVVLFEVMVLTLVFEFVQKKIFRFESLWFDLVYYISIGLGLDFVRKLAIFPSEVYQFMDMGQLSFFIKFFVLGYILKKHKLTRLLDQNWLFSLSIVVYAVSVVFMRGYFVHITTMYVLALASIVLVWYLSKNSLSGKSSDFFAYLGRNSLEIYLIHYFFLFPFEDIGAWLTNHNNPVYLQLLVDVIMALGIVLLSLGVSNVVKQSKILSFLFFGKK